MTVAVETEGEFVGWSYWPDEVYEHQTVGPFYFQRDEYGPVTAFRSAGKHMNAGGVVHGGCLLSFADVSLFVIAEDAMEGNSGLTVSMASEFLSGAPEGALIESRGEVLRAGRSLVFVRALVTADGTACLNVSATLKRIRPGA